VGCPPGNAHKEALGLPLRRDAGEVGAAGRVGPKVSWTGITDMGLCLRATPSKALDRRRSLTVEADFDPRPVGSSAQPQTGSVIYGPTGDLQRLPWTERPADVGWHLFGLA